MTGRRQGRGDPWRGGRPEGTQPERRPPYRPDGSIGRVELEELPAQQVLGRGSSGLGIGGVAAILAIVALVAAGFGVLGGRPEPTAAPTSIVQAPTPQPTPILPTPIVVRPEGPIVTPWIECGPSPESPPFFHFEHDGLAVPGTIESVLVGEGVPIPMPTVAGSTDPPPSATEVRPELVSEIWIQNAVCALGWELRVGEFEVFDEVVNDTLDPGYAAQNRFPVVLVPWEGQEIDLIGTFRFRDLAVRVSWRLAIDTVQRPSPVLSRGQDREVPLVAGCDILQTLASGWVESPMACDDDVVAAPADVARIRGGATLTFQIPDWSLDAVTIACGRMSGLSFVAATPETCGTRAERPGLDPVAFDVTEIPGAWVYAISMCGSHFQAIGANHVCGTWYAALDVHD